MAASMPLVWPVRNRATRSKGFSPCRNGGHPSGGRPFGFDGERRTGKRGHRHEAAQRRAGNEAETPTTAPSRPLAAKNTGAKIEKDGQASFPEGQNVVTSSMLKIASIGHADGRGLTSARLQAGYDSLDKCVRDGSRMAETARGFGSRQPAPKGDALCSYNPARYLLSSTCLWRNTMAVLGKNKTRRALFLAAAVGIMAGFSGAAQASCSSYPRGSQAALDCAIRESNARIDEYRRQSAEARRGSEQARREAEQARRESAEANAHTACTEFLTAGISSGRINRDAAFSAGGGRFSSENVCPVARRFGFTGRSAANDGQSVAPGG